MLRKLFWISGLKNRGFLKKVDSGELISMTYAEKNSKKEESEELCHLSSDEVLVVWAEKEVINEVFWCESGEERIKHEVGFVWLEWFNVFGGYGFCFFMLTAPVVFAYFYLFGM